MRILIVDDEPDIRGVMAAMLESHGYQVFTAANGLDATRTLLRWRPDVILLDMMMPVMNGWEFLNQLRRRGQPAPPVIVTTAAADLDPPRDAAAVLVKPVSTTALLAILHNLEHGTFERGAVKP